MLAGGAGTIAIALVAYYYILLISVLLHSSIALSTSECCILLPDKGMTKPGGGSIRHLDWEFLQSNGTLPPASSFLTKDDRISDCKKSHFIHIINPRRLAERQSQSRHELALQTQVTNRCRNGGT